ncbi:hypothetical protein PhCBS80983_g06191 [Powellomyces hirtus]|uniref:C2 domain-containing protein n=1 Tax=Powellomyces hirtus TaxID=109895 RepID=A0A507DS93_9FUNG|nr:hypothetical protein PhCBS80983_g06191 [Powellomyces hirtus]
MPLIVKLISVAGLKDEDDLGGNDLYVRLSTDNSTWVDSTVRKGAGKQAVFDEVFTFTTDPSGTLYLEVWDKDVGTDDKLGTAKISLSDVGAERDVAVELKKNILKRHAGLVNLKVGFQ